MLTVAEENVLFFFVFVFIENKAWHFMWIICQADDLHKMSSLIFSEIV